MRSGTHAPESAVYAEVRPHCGHVWKQIQAKIGEPDQHTRGLGIPILDCSGVVMTGCYRMHALPTKHPVLSVPVGFPPLPAPPSLKHDSEFTLDIHQTTLTLLPDTLTIFIDWIRNYMADNTFSFFSGEQNPNLPAIPPPNAPLKALSRALDSRVSLNFIEGVEVILPLDPSPISCIIDSINNANAVNPPNSASGIAKNLRRRELPLLHSKSLHATPRGMFVISTDEICVHVRSTLTLLDVKADVPPVVIQYVEDHDVLKINKRTSRGAMFHEIRRQSMEQTGFPDGEDNRAADATLGDKFECDMFVRVSGISYHMHVLKGPRFLPFNRHASHKLHLGGVEVQADTQFLQYVAEAAGNFAFGFGKLSKSSWTEYLLAHQVGTMKVKLAGLITNGNKKMLQQMKRQIKSQSLIAVVMFEGQIERMSFEELLRFCSQSSSSADVESVSPYFEDDAGDGVSSPVPNNLPAQSRNKQASHDTDPTMISSPSMRRRFHNSTDGEQRDFASTRGSRVTPPNLDFQELQDESEGGNEPGDGSDPWQDGGCVRRVRWRSSRGNNYEPEFEFRVTDRTQPLHILFIRTNSVQAPESKFDKILHSRAAFGEQNTDSYEDGIVAEITIPDVALVPPLTEEQCWYCGSAKSSLEVLFRSEYEPISDQAPKADGKNASGAAATSPLVPQVNQTSQFVSIDPDAYKPPAPFVNGKLVIEFDAVVESITAQIFWSPLPTSSRAPRTHMRRSSPADPFVHCGVNTKDFLAYRGVRGSEVTVISIARCGAYFGNTITPRYVQRVELVLSAIAVRHMFRHGRLNAMTLRKLQSSCRRRLNGAVWTENLRVDGGPLKVTMFFKNGVPGDPGPMAKQVHYTDCIGLYDELDGKTSEHAEDQDSFIHSFQSSGSGRVEEKETDRTAQRSSDHRSAPSLRSSEFDNNNETATTQNLYQESNIGMQETLLRTKQRMRAWLKLGHAGRKQYGDGSTTSLGHATVRQSDNIQNRCEDPSLKSWCFQTPFQNSKVKQKEQEVVLQTDSNRSTSVHPTVHPTHEQKSPDDLPAASLHEDLLSKLPNATEMPASKETALRTHVHHVRRASKYSIVGSGSSVFQTASEYTGSEASDRDSGEGTVVSDEMRTYHGSNANPDSAEKYTGPKQNAAVPLDSPSHSSGYDHDPKNDDTPDKTQAWLHEFDNSDDDPQTGASCENCDMVFDCYVYEEFPETSTKDSQRPFVHDVFSDPSFVQWQTMCRLPGPDTPGETTAQEGVFNTSDDIPVEDQRDNVNSTSAEGSNAADSDPVKWFGVGDSRTRQKGKLVEIHLQRRWCVVIGDQLVRSVANIISSWEKTASSLTNIGVVFQALMKSHTKTPTQMHKDLAAVRAAVVDTEEEEHVVSFHSLAGTESPDESDDIRSSYAQPGMKTEETVDCCDWFPAAVTTANNMTPIVETNVFQLGIDQASVFMLVPNVHSAASAQLYQIKLSHSTLAGPVLPLQHMHANADVVQEEPHQFPKQAQSGGFDEVNLENGASPFVRKQSFASDGLEELFVRSSEKGNHPSTPVSSAPINEASVRETHNDLRETSAGSCMHANLTASQSKSARCTVSMKRTKSFLQVGRASVQLQHVPKSSRHHDMDINEAFSAALHAAQNTHNRPRRVSTDSYDANLHDPEVPRFAARFIYPSSTPDMNGNAKDDTVVLIPPKYFRPLLQLRIVGMRIENTDRAKLSMQTQTLSPSQTSSEFPSKHAPEGFVDEPHDRAGDIKNKQQDILCIDPDNHISVTLDGLGMHIFDQATSSESDKDNDDLSRKKTQMPLKCAKNHSSYSSTSQVLGEITLFVRSCNWPARFMHMKQKFRKRSDRKNKVSDALTMLLLGLEKKEVMPENMHKGSASDERYSNATSADLPNPNAPYTEGLKDHRRSRRIDLHLREDKPLEVEMVNLASNPASCSSKSSKADTLQDWLSREKNRCNATVMPFFRKVVSTRDAVGWPLFVHLSRSFLQAAHERRAMLQRLVVSAVEEIVEHEEAGENAEQKQESSYLTSTIEDSIWWTAYAEQQRLLYPPEVSVEVDAHASANILASFRELMMASNELFSYDSVLHMLPMSRRMAVQLRSAQLAFWTNNQTKSFQMPAKLCFAGIIAEARKMIPPETDDESVKVLLSVKCDDIDFCVVPSFVTMLKFIVASVRRVTEPLPSGMPVQTAGSTNDLSGPGLPPGPPSPDASDVQPTVSVPSHSPRIPRQLSAPSDLSPQPDDPAGDMRNTFNRAVDNIVHMSARNPIRRLTNLFFEPPVPVLSRPQRKNSGRFGTLHKFTPEFSPRLSVPIFRSMSQVLLVPSPHSVRNSRNKNSRKQRRVSTAFNLTPHDKGTANQATFALFARGNGDGPASRIVSMNIGMLFSRVRLLILSRIPGTQHESHAAAVLIQKLNFSMSVFRDTDSSATIAEAKVDDNDDDASPHVDNDSPEHPGVDNSDGLVGITLATVQSLNVVLSGVKQTGKPSPLLCSETDRKMLILPSEWQSGERGSVVLPPPDVGLCVSDFLFHFVTFNPDDAPDNGDTPRSTQSRFPRDFSQLRQTVVTNRTISALTNVKQVRLNLPLYSVDVSKMETLVDAWIASTKAIVKVPLPFEATASSSPDEGVRHRPGVSNTKDTQTPRRSYSTLTDKVVISINFQSVVASLAIKPEVLIEYKLANSAVGFNKQSSQQKISLSVHIGPHTILFAIPQDKRRATTDGKAVGDTTPLDDEWKQKLPQVWFVMTETHPNPQHHNGDESLRKGNEDTPRDVSEHMPCPTSTSRNELPSANANCHAEGPAHVALKVSVQKVSNRFNPEQLHQLLVLLRLLSSEIMQVLKRAAEFSERVPGNNLDTASMEQHQPKANNTEANDDSNASNTPATALIRNREYQVDIQLQGIELELLTRYRLPDHSSDDDECGALVLADTGAFHLSLKSKELNLFGATTEGSVTFTGTKVVLIPQTTNPSHVDSSSNERTSDVPLARSANDVAENVDEESKANHVYSSSPRVPTDELQPASTSSLASANTATRETQKPTRQKLLLDAIFFVEVGSLAVIQQANGDTSILIQETNCIALPEMLGTIRRLVEELASHGRDYSELLNRPRLQTPHATTFSPKETHRPEELQQLRTDIAKMDVQIRHIWSHVKPDLDRQITAFRMRAHNTVRFFMEDTAVAARFTAVNGVPQSNELRSCARASDCLVVHLSTLGGRAALSTVAEERKIRVQLKSKDLHALTLDNVSSNADVFACINQSLQKARTDDGAHGANPKTSVRQVGKRLSTNRLVLPSFKSSLRVSMVRRERAQQEDSADGQNLVSHLCVTISSRANIHGPKLELNPTIVGISRSIFDSWNLTDRKSDNLRCVTPETVVPGEPAVAGAENETQTGHPDKSKLVIVVEAALNITPGCCRFYNNKSVEIGSAQFSQINTSSRKRSPSGMFTPRLNRFDRGTKGLNYWEVPLPEANLQFRKHMFIGFRDTEASAVDSGAVDRGAFQVGLDRVWVPPRVMLIVDEFSTEVNRAKQRMFARHLRRQGSSKAVKPEKVAKAKEQSSARHAAQSHGPTMTWVFRVLPCLVQFTDCPIPKANKPMRDEDNVAVEFSMRKSLEFCLSTSHVQTKPNTSLMVQSSTFRLPELRLTLAKTDEDKAFASFTISEITMHCNQAYGIRPNTYAPMTTVAWNIERIQLLVNMQSCDKMLYLIDLWKLDIERAKAARENIETDQPHWDGANAMLSNERSTGSTSQPLKTASRPRSLSRSSSTHKRSGRQPTSNSTAEDEETDGSTLGYNVDDPNSARSPRSSKVETVDSAYVILRVTIDSMQMMVDANDWIGSVLRLRAYNLALLCDDRGYSTPFASKKTEGNLTRPENFVVTAVVGKLTGNLTGKLAGNLKVQPQSGDNTKAPMCFQFIRDYRMLAAPLRRRRKLFGNKCAVNYFAIQMQAMQLRVAHDTGFDAHGSDTETLLVINADSIGAKWRDVPVQYLKILHNTDRAIQQSVPTVEHVLALLAARRRRKKTIEWCVQLSTNFTKIKVTVGARIAPTLLRDVHKAKLKFKECQQYATSMLQRKAQNTVNLDSRPRTSAASNSSQRQTFFNGERVQMKSSKLDVAVGQMKGNVTFCEIELFYDNINQKAITRLTNVSGEMVARPRLTKQNNTSSTKDPRPQTDERHLDLKPKQNNTSSTKDPRPQPDERHLEIQRSVNLQLHKGEIRVQSTNTNLDGNQVIQLPSSEALITSTERDRVVMLHEFITQWKRPIILDTDFRRSLNLVKVIKGFLREVKNNSRLQQASALGSLRASAIPNHISMDNFDLVFDEDSVSTTKLPTAKKPSALEPNGRRFDVSDCKIEVNPKLNLLGNSTPSVRTIFETFGISEDKFVKGSHELICTNMEKTLKIFMKVSTKMDSMFKH